MAGPVDTLTALVTVEGRHWAMREAQLRAMCEYLSGVVLTGDAAALKRGDDRAKPANGVSVVELKGVITPEPSLLSLFFGGGGGLKGFMADMRTAIGDPDTTAIVLDIDSPGGMVDLVPETAAELRSMRSAGKPIVAVANTVAASAAYWLASQAHEVVVTPSGEVGSVGVYSVHRDVSKAMDKEGIRHTIIKAGAHKIEGNPFEPLTDEARDAHQEQIDDYYEMFVSSVAAGRGVETPSLQDGLAFGGGRSYLARRAVTLGLADRVATLDQTVRRLGSGRARVRQTEPSARGEIEEVESRVTYDKGQRLRLLDALTSR